MDRALAFIKRDARQRRPRVAHRADHQLAVDHLRLAGRPRAHAPCVLHQLVAHHPHALHALVAQDLHRRDPEAQHDPLPAPLRLGLLVAADQLDVALVGRLDPLQPDVGPLRGVDDHVGVVQVGQLAQLRIGERRLRRTAPAQHHDLLHRRPGQQLDRVIGRVGHPQLADIQGQHPRHVQGHVAVAHHHDRPRAQVEVMIGVVRVTVVPGHELRRRMRPRKLLPRDAQLTILRRPDRIQHRVIRRGQLLMGDVHAHLHVAVEAKALLGRRLLIHPRDRLDLRMVRRHPVAHQPPRRGQLVEHVDLDHALLVGQQLPGRVEARRSRADDRHAQWIVRSAGNGSQHAIRFRGNEGPRKRSERPAGRSGAADHRLRGRLAGGASPGSASSPSGRRCPSPTCWAGSGRPATAPG